jgi:hypothetical protein
VDGEERVSTSSRPPTRISEARGTSHTADDISLQFPSTGSSFDSESPSQRLSASISTLRTHQSLREDSTSTPTHNQSSSKARHVGDLNPESIFLAAASPTATVNGSESSSVGIWIKENQAGTTKNYYSNLSLQQSRSVTLHSSDPLIQQLLLPYLEDQCLSFIPDKEDYDVLRAIYFAKVNPIISILDRETFDALDPSAPSTIVLKQGVCLVASMHKVANDHLRVPRTTGLNRVDFVTRLSSAMKTSLDLGLVTDKTALIQALCLLYLFTQGADRGDVPAELCTRAVHHAFTIGLHLPGGEKFDKRAERLFFSVWALDRLNAAFHGRPISMHERDLGRDLDSAIKKQEPCFQLFLRVVLILDKVISLYRPVSQQSSTSIESEFVDFEQLVIASNGTRIDTPLLGMCDWKTLLSEPQVRARHCLK